MESAEICIPLGDGPKQQKQKQMKVLKLWSASDYNFRGPWARLYLSMGHRHNGLGPQKGRKLGGDLWRFEIIGFNFENV